MPWFTQTTTAPLTEAPEIRQNTDKPQHIIQNNLEELFSYWRTPFKNSKWEIKHLEMCRWRKIINTTEWDGSGCSTSRYYPITAYLHTISTHLVKFHTTIIWKCDQISWREMLNLKRLSNIRMNAIAFLLLMVHPGSLSSTFRKELGSTWALWPLYGQQASMLLLLRGIKQDMIGLDFTPHAALGINFSHF